MDIPHTVEWTAFSSGLPPSTAVPWSMRGCGRSQKQFRCKHRLFFGCLEAFAVSCKSRFLLQQNTTNAAVLFTVYFPQQGCPKQGTERKEDCPCRRQGATLSLPAAAQKRPPYSWRCTGAGLRFNNRIRKRFLLCMNLCSLSKAFSCRSAGGNRNGSAQVLPDPPLSGEVTELWAPLKTRC